MKVLKLSVITAVLVLGFSQSVDGLFAKVTFLVVDPHGSILKYSISEVVNDGRASPLRVAEAKGLTINRVPMFSVVKVWLAPEEPAQGYMPVKAEVLVTAAEVSTVIVTRPYAGDAMGIPPRLKGRVVSLRKGDHNIPLWISAAPAFGPIETPEAHATVLVGRDGSFSLPGHLEGTYIIVLCTERRVLRVEQIELSAKLAVTPFVIPLRQ